MAKRKYKPSAEELQRQAKRAELLTTVQKAIIAGTAWLDTAWGRRKVIGYRDDSGWAFTRNDGERDGRSFMVCLDNIKY